MLKPLVISKLTLLLLTKLSPLTVLLMKPLVKLQRVPILGLLLLTKQTIVVPKLLAIILNPLTKRHRRTTKIVKSLKPPLHTLRPLRLKWGCWRCWWSWRARRPCKPFQQKTFMWDSLQSDLPYPVDYLVLFHGELRVWLK